MIKWSNNTPPKCEPGHTRRVWNDSKLSERSSACKNNFTQTEWSISCNSIARKKIHKDPKKSNLHFLHLFRRHLIDCHIYKSNEKNVMTNWRTTVEFKQTKEPVGNHSPVGITGTTVLSVEFFISMTGSAIVVVTTESSTLLTLALRKQWDF